MKICYFYLISLGVPHTVRCVCVRASFILSERNSLDRLATATTSHSPYTYASPRVFSYRACVMMNCAPCRLQFHLCWCVFKCVRLCTATSLLQQHTRKQLSSNSGYDSDSWVRFVVVCYSQLHTYLLSVDNFLYFFFNLFISLSFRRFVSLTHTRIGSARTWSVFLNWSHHRSRCNQPNKKQKTEKIIIFISCFFLTIDFCRFNSFSILVWSACSECVRGVRYLFT